MILNTISRLISINARNPTYYRFGLSSVHNLYSTTSKENEDAPVKYSTSDAAKWRARYTRLGDKKTQRLWYEPYVILASVAVFMIYFTVLREENDIDAGFERSLFERFPQMEEQQLHQLLEYNRIHHLDNTQVLARLEEIKSQQT